MMIRSFLTLILTCFVTLVSYAIVPVTGVVTDADSGEPVSYVTVYVKGTTLGTTTNSDGKYTLELARGEYDLIFRFIGYQQVQEHIVVGSEPVTLNVKIAEINYEITEVEITAGGEDPAYAIIRKAQRKRSVYLREVKRFSCDAYVKGTQRLLDAPQGIMGIQIGDMDGMLDSNRQGIIYLSESLSRYFFEQPDKYHEEMKYSKVSGDDNGWSFNSAQSMDVNFYENQNDFGRPIISPIADGAMTFYRYKLEGAFVDENGVMVNKIKVTPKRETDPAYRGYIFIAENSWRIYSTDLMISSDASKIPVLDSVVIRQTHVPINGEDVWRLFQQNLSFEGKALGFKFRGDYLGVFTKYEIEPTVPKRFFSGEILKVDPKANKYEETTWDSIRPVPLTLEEAADYHKKDSLARVWKSKPFMDSVDRAGNKFKILDLLTGYSYSNSYKKQSFTIESPIQTVQFNAVQGLNLYLNMRYRKGFNEDNSRWTEIAPSVQYGFSDQQLRGALRWSYHFNNMNFAQINVSGGRLATQYNQNNPISLLANSVYSLRDKFNYMKIYDRYFGRVDYEQELTNGIFMRTGLEYNYREALRNHTNYSIRRQDWNYMNNTPIDGDYSPVTGPAFASHTALVLNLSLRFRPGQKFMRFPDRKILVRDSKWPTFSLHYRGGLPGGDARFQHIAGQIEYTRPMGLVGTSEINVEGGFFPVKDRVESPDLKHFNGNLTWFGRPSRYMSSFLLLPYYIASTNEPYMQLHYEHHFNGFIFNKIPLLKRTGFTEVVGVHMLYTNTFKPYTEFTFGVDRIGWSLFRLLRLDYAFSISSDAEGGFMDQRLIIGINL